MVLCMAKGGMRRCAKMWESSDHAIHSSRVLHNPFLNGDDDIAFVSLKVARQIHRVLVGCRSCP